MNLRKGDNVMVISGKDKGQTGKIEKILLAKDRVLVKDLNTVKKRTRPTRQGEKGQTVSIARSLHISNVMLVCKNCKKPTRIGYRMDGDQKIRICKKCEASN
jgi:large subunit ribosomal protein L24